MKGTASAAAPQTTCVLKALTRIQRLQTADTAKPTSETITRGSGMALLPLRRVVSKEESGRLNATPAVGRRPQWQRSAASAMLPALRLGVRIEGAAECVDSWLA